MSAGSSPNVPPRGAVGGSFPDVTPEQAPLAQSRLHLGNEGDHRPRNATRRDAASAERDRIAAALSTNIVQRLFAAGLALDGASSGLRTSTTVQATIITAHHVDNAVRILDETINEIRAIIFPGTERGAAEGPNLPGRLQAVVTDMAAVLGFPPSVFLSAALTGAVPRDLGDDLVVALRESLANVVRHARARSVAVSVRMIPGRLSLEVTDDGVGIGRMSRNRGLRFMQERAEQHSGTLWTSTLDHGGTRVVWSVPL